jgi:hypothetical protein
MATIALLFCGIYPVRLLFAQNAVQQSTSSQQSASRLEKQWNKAHNQWQRTPVDISTQTDTARPDIREKRTAHWKQMPLFVLKGGMKSSTGFPADLIADIPETDEPKDAEIVWVVARFEAWHVYPINSEETLFYTEKSMRILSVISTPADLSVPVGSLIDVQMLGGTAKTHDGSVRSSAVNPKQFSAQPDHTYLLHLLYKPTDAVFTTWQRWEVSDNVLIPDDPDTFRRAQQGKSMLAGTTVAEASAHIRAALNAQNGK